MAFTGSSAHFVAVLKQHCLLSGLYKIAIIATSRQVLILISSVASQQQSLVSEQHAYLLLGLSLATTVITKAISLMKVVGLKDCDA